MQKFCQSSDFRTPCKGFVVCHISANRSLRWGDTCGARIKAYTHKGCKPCIRPLRHHPLPFICHRQREADDATDFAWLSRSEHLTSKPISPEFESPRQQKKNAHKRSFFVLSHRRFELRTPWLKVSLAYRQASNAHKIRLFQGIQWFVIWLIC